MRNSSRCQEEGEGEGDSASYLRSHSNLKKPDLKKKKKKPDLSLLLSHV